MYSKIKLDFCVKIMIIQNKVNKTEKDKKIQVDFINDVNLLQNKEIFYIEFVNSKIY